MRAVGRAVRDAIVVVAVFAGALLLEHGYITDADLRYPVVLLTALLGAILAVILVVRVPWVFAKEKVRAISPGAAAGLKSLGGMLLVTLASLGGCVFGVTLMRPRPGVIEYWPLGIVLVFGGLALNGMRYLRREWQMYQRLSNRRS